VLAFVPLDDRPSNRLYPRQLVPVVGWDLTMPPRECLGWFKRPGDCDAIGEWIAGSKASRLVVSLDMLCYGGLVASRAPGATPEEALGRLAALRDLRRRRAEVTLFAFSTIMRLGTTAASSADLDVHQMLVRYSRLVDQVERLGDAGAQRELDQVQERLPRQILADYLAARRRNHAVNRAAVQLVAEGVLDFLVLAQEDAAPVGIHIPEQRALLHHVEEYHVADRVVLSPGADEVGLVLMARQVLAAAPRPVCIAVEYAAEEGADVVPAFEGQPLGSTAESQLRAAGARLTPPGDADALLFVHTPIGEQRDIAQAPPDGGDPGLARQSDDLAERVAAAARGSRVGIADAAYCNGADPGLMDALRRRGVLSHLGAFAGWNTAANTVGTAVAQLCLEAATDPEPGTAAWGTSRSFLAGRVVEDYHYQTRVRPRAMARARAAGADPLSLGGAWRELERYVSGELEPLAHEIYSEVMGDSSGTGGVEVRVSLPWHRLFEVAVEVVPVPAPKNR
jgi:hypothetical protein